MKLEDVLWTTVMWVVVIFFAFAAGVKAGEWEKEDAEEPVEYTLVISEPQTQMAAMPIPATETAQEPQLDLCEDTYLRDDIPLSHEMQALLYGACKEFGIDYPLALAVIEQETNFRNVKGDSGQAYGFFQIWPRWHGERMDEIGVTDLMDPEGNFRVGCSFLSECIEKYGLEKGLGYYNSGKAQVTKYSREVMEKMEKYYG